MSVESVASGLYPIVVAATAQALATSSGEPLTDAQIIAITVASGLAGGFASTLNEKNPIATRQIIGRMIAAGAIVPAAVVGLFEWFEIHPTLLFVFAASAVSGIFAWPLWEASLPSIKRRVVRAIKEREGE